MHRHVGGVSTHSRPKAAALTSNSKAHKLPVSTHSRLKAAARRSATLPAVNAGFNSQPPEGGCHSVAPRKVYPAVSTHSRPKAAAYCTLLCASACQSFQLTAARRRLRRIEVARGFVDAVSTHSRPKAAASLRNRPRPHNPTFQLTAARRRLPTGSTVTATGGMVSTHSRPKAAAYSCLPLSHMTRGFNSQPPEGGCVYGS